MDFATYWIITPVAGNALALPLWVFLSLTGLGRGEGAQWAPHPTQARLTPAALSNSSCLPSACV